MLLFKENFMVLAKMRRVLWLALVVHVGAFAQTGIQPGKWELTGSFKGLPFGGAEERVRVACISEAALASMPERALMEAAPSPSGTTSRPAPQCAYSKLRREGSLSSWALRCADPVMLGTGSAALLPERVDLQETLEMQSFGSPSVQHLVRARRLGDCS
jgi:hypothetical protein